VPLLTPVASAPGSSTNSSSTTPLKAGANTVTAQYVGDGLNYAPSSVVTITQTVNSATCAATNKILGMTANLDGTLTLNFLGTPTNGWGPVERDTSNGEQAAGDGHTMSINGATFTKGLGAHANSSIVYVNTDIETNVVNNKQEWIYESDNSGQTWQAAVNGGGDPVAAGFDGTGVFISTGDGGIFRDPMNVYDNRGNSLNTIEFYGFSLDPSDPRRAYGLFQDGPGVLRYVGTVDWQYSQPSGGQGEAGKIRVDPTNSNRVYYLDPNTANP
jgi:hypothetical protein